MQYPKLYCNNAKLFLIRLPVFSVSKKKDHILAIIDSPQKVLPFLIRIIDIIPSPKAPTIVSDGSTFEGLVARNYLVSRRYIYYISWGPSRKRKIRLLSVLGFDVLETFSISKQHSRKYTKVFFLQIRHPVRYIPKVYAPFVDDKYNYEHVHVLYITRSSMISWEDFYAYVEFVPMRGGEERLEKIRQMQSGTLWGWVKATLKDLRNKKIWKDLRDKKIESFYIFFFLVVFLNICLEVAGSINLGNFPF